MKPTSPISLLLFLRLASATPLPLTLDALYPTDCHSKSCIISLLTTPHTNHHTPPTRLTEPHFPSHQLSSESPLSAPSSSDISTPAVTSSRPLSSSFLLSLTNPASHPSIQKAPGSGDHSAESTENLPAKPSSALAELRAADLRKYWETLRPASAQAASPKNGQVQSCEMGMSGEMVGSERFYYMRRTRTSGRDYADLMVVGIVVLFLAVVVALEAVERCSDLSGILCGRRQRRGEIFLEDDDNLFIVKRPFELSPAPAARNKRDSMDYRNEKDAFAYDSDAAERV